jgi:hypothetical protein
MQPPIDVLAESRVIPAKAGIQTNQRTLGARRSLPQQAFGRGGHDGISDLQ